MASLDHDRPTFSATNPHFFKIILNQTSRNTKLKIPINFVMKYGEHMSSPVVVKLPSGSEWKIELKRRNGELWFEKGWPEFSEFYSIDYGHWLAFGYEGNSNFHAFIFDRSCTEIDYPMTMPDKPKTDYEDDDDDDSVEILDDFPPSTTKKRKKSPLTCPLPRKKMRTYSRQPCEMMFEKSVKKNEEDLVETLDSLPSCPRKGDKSLLTIALQRAIAFKSVNPFFRVVMHPSYIEKGRAGLPLGFVKRHLIKKPSGNAIFKVLEGGSSWCVKLKLASTQAQFQGGWLEFVRDNHLEVGDVCVFILTKNTEISFDVVFFRTNEDEKSPLPPGQSKILKTGNSSLRALEAANKFIPKNPFFRSAIGPKCANVYVPSRFSRTYIGKKPIVTLQVGERSWSVNHWNGSSTKLTGGWPAFAREHCLRKGDVCTFELIEVNDAVFKVHIFRR